MRRRRTRWSCLGAVECLAAGCRCRKWRHCSSRRVPFLPALVLNGPVLGVVVTGRRQADEDRVFGNGRGHKAWPMRGGPQVLVHVSCQGGENGIRRAHDSSRDDHEIRIVGMAQADNGGSPCTEKPIQDVARYNVFRAVEEILEFDAAAVEPLTPPGRSRQQRMLTDHTFKCPCACDRLRTADVPAPALGSVELDRDVAAENPAVVVYSAKQSSVDECSSADTAAKDDEDGVTLSLI